MPNDLVITDVSGNVQYVVERLKSELSARGVEVFATIDHAGGARAAGLQLADEVLLVFGNPAVGTALLQADPRVGLDLPLRMLVWSELETTRVAYQDPADLADRYALDGTENTVTKLRGLMKQLVAGIAKTGDVP